jgi:hypothetical protein
MFLSGRLNVATKAVYILRDPKTHNAVYVKESFTLGRISGYRRALFVSMCGYGPDGFRSKRFHNKSLQMLREELSLFWKYPKRKKDLDKLVVERYDPKSGAQTFPSMKRILKEVERELLFKKLKGEPI